MPKKPARPRRAGAFEIRVALRHVSPPIWRQLLVMTSATLHDLHRTLQEAFGWQDYHLYEFKHGARRFEVPRNDEATGEDSTRITLADLGLKQGDRLSYTYDFGDDWALDVTVLGTRAYDPGTTYPWCLDGARAGPPEDCGGPPGYQRLLDVLADPSHPEFLDQREWVGSHFHPEMFDLRATNRILQLAFE